MKEEWWTAPTTLRTNADGRLTVEGWKGSHRVTAAGLAAEFDLAVAPEELTLR